MYQIDNFCIKTIKNKNKNKISIFYTQNLNLINYVIVNVFKPDCLLEIDLQSRA